MYHKINCILFGIFSLTNLVKKLTIKSTNPYPMDKVMVYASQLLYHVVWPCGCTVPIVATSLEVRLLAFVVVVVVFLLLSEVALLSFCCCFCCCCCCCYNTSSDFPVLRSPFQSLVSSLFFFPPFLNFSFSLILLSFPSAVTSHELEERGGRELLVTRLLLEHIYIYIRRPM